MITWDKSSVTIPSLVCTNTHSHDQFSDPTKIIQQFKKKKDYLLASSQVYQVKLSTEFLLSFHILLFNINEEDTVAPRAVFVHICNHIWKALFKWRKTWQEIIFHQS